MLNKLKRDKKFQEWLVNRPGSWIMCEGSVPNSNEDEITIGDNRFLITIDKYTTYIIDIASELQNAVRRLRDELDDK
jgi:hypothetical protein